MFSPGRVVATHFRLIELLGEGGMGSVWAARDARDGREVALKFIKDSEDHSGRRRRLVREARAAMSLGHPNVVHIHDVVEGPPPFIVMDRLRGESLASRLRRQRRLPLPQFADIFLQVLSAVGAAHAARIIHRDLKPANIFLVDHDGRVEVRVLDFGIAKFTGQDLATASTNLTNTGDLLGTPQYMAPEQIFGETDLDHRADVWALGIIAYECLAGRHPISGDNIGQVIKAITSTTLPTLDVDVPTPVRQMVTRMMSRSRSVRPSDLSEVIEVFRAHARVVVPAFGAPASLPSSDDEMPASPLPPTMADSVDSVAGPSLRRRSSKWTFAFLALGGALAVGIAANRFRSQRPATPLTPTASGTPSPSVSPATVTPMAPEPSMAASSADAGTTPIVDALAPAPRIDAGIRSPAQSTAPSTAPSPSKKGPHDEDI